MVQKLLDLLKESGVEYKEIVHPPVFFSMDVAVTANVPCNKMAKTFLAWADGHLVMAILPASTMVSLSGLRNAIHAKIVRKATEDETKEFFPDYDTGAMPPVKSEGVLVVLDSKIRKADEVVFRGGNHSTSVKVTVEDFMKLSKADIEADFSVERSLPDGDREIDKPYFAK